MANEKWTTVIKPRKGFGGFQFGDVWKYRDLILLFVRREFVSKYKQTILGPAWAVIQPLFTSVIFTLVFGGIAGLSTDGAPQFLFYMAGNVCWVYFANSLTNTANTFITNAPIMSKVYFPRLVMPISIVISQLIAFFIEFAFFMIIWAVYMFIPGSGVAPNLYMLLFPLFVLQMMLLSLGFGSIVSSLTTKYKDLQMLISFLVQLWMYATPVAYSAELMAGNPVIYNIMMCNPMAPIVTGFRYAFLGSGGFDLMFYGISWGVTIIVFLLGVMMFNKVEKTFADTI